MKLDGVGGGSGIKGVMNRRRFLQVSGAGLLVASLWGGTAPKHRFLVDVKKRVGLIGCGWYGKSALLRLLQVAPAEVVALCDVDRRMLEEAADIVASRQLSKKRPKLYHDFREMLRNESFDIVQVSTPDHWHALAMIEAVKAGTDVYVEKPISRDVIEGQAMLAAARKYGRVVQVGLQRRSTPHLIEAKERFIDTGKLGKIAYAEICCYYHMRTRRRPHPTEPPPTLDWNFWVGPAPWRPYDPAIHPRGWRSFIEYCNGIVGDMAVHMLDMVRWMLGLRWPKRISSSGGILVDPESVATIPDTQTITFDFENLPIVWTHRTWGTAPDPDYPWAAFIYGEKGTLKLSVYRYDFVPTNRREKPIHGEVVYELDQYPEDRTEKDLEKHVAPALRRHWVNFLHAIETRGRPVSDIEEGYISSSCCILGNVALQIGRTLLWDPVQGRIVGDEEANQLLARPYRAPWIHPDPKKV